MKVFLAMVLSVALVIICMYIYKTCQAKHKLTHVVARLLQIGFIVVFVNIVSLFVTSEKIVLLTYCIYFAATDWLLYYLLYFSLEYIGFDFEKYVNKKLMVIVLTADSVAMLVNLIYPYQFSVWPATVLGDGSYFKAVITPIFYIHYVIILIMAILCLVALFYGAVKAPAFYRGKYLNIGIITLIIVVLNIFTMHSPIDISVIGYAVEAVCIYYCVFVYTPQRLLPKSLFQVAQEMSVALLVMDIEGKLLYSNRRAEELLSKEVPLVDRDGRTLEQWCREQYITYNEVFTKEQVFYHGEDAWSLKIQLCRLVDSRKQLQGGYFVIQDRTEEINNLKRERYLATHDRLTGLYNKEYFYERAEKYIRRHPDQELLMICTDIKDFKMINDSMGTKTGDVVLQNFAHLMESQIEGIILYGRLGNDNFGMLMDKYKYREELFMQEEPGKYFTGVKEGVSFPIVCYIGVYEVKERNIPASVMCDRARMAIATIKGDYHKRVAYYDNKLRDNILYEQELIADLDDALADGQLKMYLQPQMSTDGKLLGAEALVRWFHPYKGAILPGDFIPVFERNGLISDVDLYIWELACRQLRKWKDEGREDIYISVNISPRDFYFLNIFQIFTDLVAKYDIAPRNIKLEITETAVVMDFERQMELISRLRRNGFVVEMDDFGSGYSSLNMLKDIHVDVLKIDMAFLRKAEDEERSRKILQMIISLSRQLGMPVITEGVETQEQIQDLAEMGCEMFQGYYFAKPMSVEEFEATYLK